jgi:hypothetical protein
MCKKRPRRFQCEMVAGDADNRTLALWVRLNLIHYDSREAAMKTYLAYNQGYDAGKFGFAYINPNATVEELVAWSRGYFDGSSGYPRSM